MDTKMTNWNKSNPFVIIIGKRHDMMEALFLEITKTLILSFVINAIIFIASMTYSIFFTLSVISPLIIVNGLSLITLYGYTIYANKYIYHNEYMSVVNEILQSEVAEVLSMNNETLFNATTHVSEIIGRCNCFSVMTKSITAFNIIASIIIILLSILGV